MANSIPPPAPTVPNQPYVEDCPEDDQAARPENRPPANISTKRSKPDVAPVRTPQDVSSDSGFSSHTAATLGSSAPSSLESKVGSNPPKIGESTAASKRRSKAVETVVVKGKPHSPEKPSLRKTQTKSKKDTSDSPPKGKGKAKNLLSGLLRSSKAPPPQVVQEAPKPPPARPRTSTSQPDHRSRPTSVYATGTAPVYVQQPVFIERHPTYPPPPSRPVFPPPSYPPPSYPPLQNSYFTPLPHVPPPHQFYSPALPTSIPLPRPSPSLWGHGVSATPRPRSMYEKPMVEYGEEPIYTTIAPGVAPSRPHRLPPKEHSYPPPEEYSARREDRGKMLPPPPPKINTRPQVEQRPPVRHAHTTSDAHPPHRSHRSGHEESAKVLISNRSPTKQSFAEHEQSRRPTSGTPKRSDESIPHGHGLERTSSRMSTGSTTVKKVRPSSMYGPEALAEKEASVQAYQDEHRRPGASNTLPIDTLGRGKKLHGGSSEASSRHSAKSGKSKTSREGSDVKSRRPSSEVKSRNHDDGIAMRFKPSTEINVELKGGMEGRKISMKPSKDGEGELEFAIGPRGRTVGSRSQAPSRDRSRRSYSYIDGQGVAELERPKTSGRPPREYAYHSGSSMTPIDRMRTTESIKEEREPVIFREKVTTRSRSRRNSVWGRG